MRPTTAKINFNEHGTPVAEHFDDVYFSNDNGIAETRYVFIEGNQLWQRWQNHPHAHYVVAETGFGTGLNLFVTMSLFTQFIQANPEHPLKRLFFLTTEKYPLTKEDLAKALAQYQDFADTKQQLLEQYPVLLEGCHRLTFNNNSVIMDLWLGDVEQTLPTWHCPRDGLVDSWFLDGFAPSKNPQMWSETLFTQMVRLSKHNTSFATFTAAGRVKRGLQAVGFEVTKIKGFGRKREMLVGSFTAPKNIARAIYAPLYRYLSPTLTNTSRVAIIGGGIAAATLADALARRGFSCAIYCADNALAQGASGNPQGGVYPQLHVEASIPAQIQATTFVYARRYFEQVEQKGNEFAHAWCGVLLPAFKAEVAQRQKKLLASKVWPEQLVRAVNASEANAISGITINQEGLFMPLGGWLNPAQLVNALCYQAGIGVHLQHRLINVDYATSNPNTHPITLTFEVSSSQISTSVDADTHIKSQQRKMEVDHVIFAQGHQSDTNDLLSSLPFQHVRGQVEAIPSRDVLGNLTTVICHKGYLTPAYAGRHALGSTYVKNDNDIEVRPTETELNLATHRKALPTCDSLNTAHHDGCARASVRMTLPDHQPAVGLIHDWTAVREEYAVKLSKDANHTQLPLPPQTRCSVLSGLGSRGLTTAPLLAEMLISQLCGEPLPLPNTLLDALSPARFVLKNFKRKQTV